MSKENIIRAVAGTLVLTGAALALLVNIYWLALVLFVGLNLLQSSFTHFCPLEKILDAAGIGKTTGTCK